MPTLSEFEAFSRDHAGLLGLIGLVVSASGVYFGVRLAFDCVAQMRPGEAETFHRRALAIREKALGDEHPDTVRTLHDLATLVHRRGFPGQAEPFYERALIAGEKCLDEADPLLQSILSDYAGLLHQTGNTTRAEVLWKRLEEIRQRNSQQARQASQT